MILRLALFGLMALGLLGFGVVAYVSANPPAPREAGPPPPPTTTTLLVATHEVRAGSLLKLDDLGGKEMPVGSAPPGATPDSPEARRSLAGGMVRRGLAVGEVISNEDVMRPGDHGFLAAVLRPGMRAVTVGVDAISGSAGLIWPGDRVDVIMTQAIEEATLPLGRRVAAETVLRDARVIAIDQDLVQGATPGNASTQTARTVTLEVTQEQGERVQVATRIGRLSLAVRSAELSQNPPQPDRRPTFASDVSHALAADAPVRDQPKTIHIYGGSAAGKEFRF
jgi:pilus assembly protein CpaB